MLHAPPSGARDPKSRRGRQNQVLWSAVAESHSRRWPAVGGPAVRHRSAIELLAEERRERAERQDIDADDQAWVAFKAAVTADEIRVLNGLANQMRLIKAHVYQRCPDARPASYIAPTPVATNDYAPGTLFLHADAKSVCEATSLEEPRPSATDVAEVVVDARPGAPQARERTPPRRLDQERYAEVGLFVEDGVISHALGDEHARSILEGRMTFEERAHQHALDRNKPNA